MKVYLGGEITGKTPEEALIWREQVTRVLATDGIETVCPMRGRGDTDTPGKIIPSIYGHTDNDTDAAMRSPSGIIARDYYDIRRCDVLLANLGDTCKVSIGTVMELAFAYTLHKIVVGILDARHEHVFTVECVTHQVKSLSSAIDVIRRLK